MKSEVGFVSEVRTALKNKDKTLNRQESLNLEGRRRQAERILGKILRKQEHLETGMAGKV